MSLKRALPGPPKPVQAFKEYGEDFVIAHSLKELVDRYESISR